MWSLIVLSTFWATWLVQFPGYFARVGVFQGCEAEQAKPWSYKGLNGPSNWGLRYPLCNGRKQSPINIDSRQTVSNTNLTYNIYNYNVPLRNATIMNTGYTVRFQPTDNTTRGILVGENRKNYSLQQGHFHWGNTSVQGAEHFIDGHQYAMEMHLVHGSTDSNIAVLGILFQQTEQSNPNLDPIINSLKYIRYKDQKTQMASSFNIMTLLEFSAAYYSYLGSLTTPDCSQDLAWFVLKTIVPIGHEQLDALRNLSAVKKSEGECPLANNYRPLQPLNGRKVYSSD